LGRFLDATASHRFGPLYEFLAFTGLRRGEACALRWSDVVLEDRVLNVRSSLVQVGPKWIEGKPKTASGERRVDLGERTVGLLLMVQLAQDQDQERERWGAAYQDNGRVFAREDGSDVSPETVTKTFGRLAKAAGLRSMRLHDLRHVAASLMISSGADIAVVSKRLGHSTLGVTSDLYGHLFASAGRAAADATEALVPPHSALSA